MVSTIDVQDDNVLLHDVFRNSNGGVDKAIESESKGFNRVPDEQIARDKSIIVFQPSVHVRGKGNSSIDEDAISSDGRSDGSHQAASLTNGVRAKAKGNAAPTGIRLFVRWREERGLRGTDGQVLGKSSKKDSDLHDEMGLFFLIKLIY